MTYLLAKNPPKNEEDLLQTCANLEGLTFAQLAHGLNIIIPEIPQKRKGWIGQAIELALGTTAKTKALPDFCELGIELKTLPILPSGKPAESTFVTSIPLLTIAQQKWEYSQCFAKLKRILWFPLEGDSKIPYHNRRLGSAFLWSPNAKQSEVLEEDWQYLTTLISTGYIQELDAKLGEYLQIRPKAANGKSLCYAFDAKGNKVQTLPRGFYLRSHFTEEIYRDKFDETKKQFKDR